jgi:7,8-dihydropterin-6-yl-methyl-4-(beta-D-ribofuranosyl)aminobenzene 5'-phosphate synthase
MGGMAYLLSVNPKVKIYAPKEGFGVYGGDLPSTFYRKDASLPPEQRYYDGAPPAVMRFGAAWPGVNFELIDKTTEVAPGIHLIALVSDKPGTLELRELSLAINTLCANVLETPTPIEFSVEGGEAEDHGVAEGVGLRG